MTDTRIESGTHSIAWLAGAIGAGVGIAALAYRAGDGAVGTVLGIVPMS